MMDRVQLGIIGCGVIGALHASAAAESRDIDLIAVADISEKKAQHVADLHHVEQVYGQGRELLANPNVKAVVLAVPTGRRAPLVRQAMKTNRHVLIEKPVAMNLRQLRGFLKLQNDCVAACASSRFRAYASAKAAQRFIASGKLGDVRVIRVRAIVPNKGKPKVLPPDWRLSRKLNAGGVLVNWGVYDLDYLMGLFVWQLKPISVMAQCWSIPPIYQKHVTANSDAETQYVAMIRCAGGEVINIERGEYMPTSQSAAAWEIQGTGGTLRLNMMPGEKKQIVFDQARSGKGIVSKTIWEGEDQVDSIHAGPVRDFGHAIRFGHVPLTSLAQEVVITQLTDAIYASASRQKTIEL